MLKRKLCGLTAALFFMISGPAFAEEWCAISPGFEVVTNGMITDGVWLYAQLPNQSSPIWILIANSTMGKNNVALALAAQMSGRGVAIYLHSPTATCANFPNWSSDIRHLKILN